MTAEREKELLALTGVKQARIIGGQVLLQGDCREILPKLGKVDAVVTDPPYGNGEAAGKNRSRVHLATAKDYGYSEWDSKPAHEAIAEAVAAAKWSVVFGGNYYDLPPTSCWLIWDKLNGASDFADCEMAWTNLPKAVRRIQWLWNGMLRAEKGVREHPTQKPVGVMKWCIEHLPAPHNQTILDPFMGSGTTLVACQRLGRNGIGIEIDEGYFDIACRRIEQAYAQPDLFVAQPKPKPTQHGFDI